jgi:hypothetical protein
MHDPLVAVFITLIICEVLLLAAWILTGVA